MAIVPDHSTSSSAADDEAADFGANDWLLQEMYEQYTADPESVDPSWAEFFKAHGAPDAASSISGGNGENKQDATSLKAAPTERRAAQPPTSKPTQGTQGGRPVALPKADANARRAAPAAPAPKTTCGAPPG